MKSPRHIYGRLGGAHPSRISALSPAAWYQPGVGLTGSLTVSNWADQSGNGRDLAQGTAGNQPYNLAFSGSPYAWLPAVASNTFTTPNQSVTGSFVLTFDIALNDYTPAGDVTLLSKTSGNDGFSVLWLTTDKLRLVIGDGASLTNCDASVASGLTDASRHTITITWADGVGASLAIDGAAWGSAIVAAKTLTNAAVAFTLGSSTSIGKVYGVTLGSLVNFDPSRFIETSTNGTTATMSTGEVWTLNSSGAYPATIVKSSQILFGGVDEYLKTASFSINPPLSIYIVCKQVTWTSNDVIYSGTNIYMHQKVGGASPQISASAGTSSSVNSNLAVGSYGIVTTVFNGAGSVLQVNNTTAVTGDFGSGGISGGFWLGDYYSLGIPSNIIVKEVIIFSAAHTAAQRAVVQAYLAARHGIAL